MKLRTIWTDTLPDVSTIPGTCRVYKKFGNPVSIVAYAHRCVYKTAHRMGGIDAAIEATESWRSMGFSGAPSSPASFFREAFVRWGPKQVTPKVDPPGVRGGWMETFRARGPVREALTEYDVNKAYLWGGTSIPFPVFTRFTPNLTARTFMVWAKTRTCHLEAEIEPRFPDPPRLPKFLRVREGKQLLLSPKQMDLWRPDVEVIGCFESIKDSSLAVESVIDRLHSLPDTVRNAMLSRYWGVWLPSYGMTDCTYIDGAFSSSRRMRSDMRITNPAFAQAIVDNVGLRIFDDIRYTNPVSVHVDNVIAEAGAKLPIDPDRKPGTWKRQRSMPNGIYLEGTGLWHEDPDSAMAVDRRKWTKHAGYGDVRAAHDGAAMDAMRETSRAFHN